MLKTRQQVLTGVLALLFSSTPLAAGAATLHRTLAGPSLAIDSPCAKRVEISVGDARAVQVTASSDHPEEIDRLRFDGAGAATIRTAGGRCWRPFGAFAFQPTLVLAVQVPDRFPTRIDEAGKAVYRIGRLEAPLDVQAAGAIDLSAQAVTKLSLDLSGSGTVAVGSVIGAARIAISGSGAVTIDDGKIDQASVDQSGTGSFRLQHGAIEHLAVQDSGAGRVRIDGTVGDATVDLSGLGSVSLARLTGQLTKNISGMGDVRIGGR